MLPPRLASAEIRDSDALRGGESLRMVFFATPVMREVALMLTPSQEGLHDGNTTFSAQAVYA